MHKKTARIWFRQIENNVHFQVLCPASPILLWASGDHRWLQEQLVLDPHRGHGISRVVETDETGWDWPLAALALQAVERSLWTPPGTQMRMRTLCLATEVSTVFSRVFFSSKDGWRGCRFLLILQGLAVACRYTTVFLCGRARCWFRLNEGLHS